MLFIGFSVLIVGVAMLYALYARACDLYGVMETRAWISTLPPRTKRALVTTCAAVSRRFGRRAKALKRALVAGGGSAATRVPRLLRTQSSIV